MKPDLKHLWKTKKKWIIGITAGVAVAAVGCGFWYQAGHSSKNPVYVYPFQYIGMTEYWGDSQESNGPVSTDKIQTVFLSETQTITEILVQAGDTVKKGDLLMSFDTTLTDLQLERKRLDVEKRKLELEDAQKELRRINGMKPMQVPEPSEEEEEGSGDVLTSPELFPRDTDLVNKATYDGRSADKALIYWILGDTPINDTIFAAADSRAAKLQAANDLAQPEQTEPEAPEFTLPELDKEEIKEGIKDYLEGLLGRIPSNASEVTSESLPDGSSFYVVIKVSAGNTTLGEKKVWQCLKVTKSGGSYSFRFADTLIADYSMLSFMEDSGEAEPEVDYGSGFTAAQIAQMRADQQKKIKDLEFQIKMAEAEYKIMQREASDGKVYAENDGKVISLLTEEEARQTQQPVLKVSGGGGFYVEGFISELEKAKMEIGQEVSVNDWNTGMTYTGSIVSVGEFPTRDGYYNGNGNPNASYYPFKVFVDETADLQAGRYVSVTWSTAGAENGIYLENPFLRTEKGKSYVLVLGADGKLEQRWVTTGKSLWGSYTQILSGLSAEDLIAFPYGKNVKPGVAAVEGDMSNLYG